MPPAKKAVKRKLLDLKRVSILTAGPSATRYELGNCVPLPWSPTDSATIARIQLWPSDRVIIQFEDQTAVVLVGCPMVVELANQPEEEPCQPSSIDASLEADESAPKASAATGT